MVPSRNPQKAWHLCRSILDDYAKSNANQQMAKDSNRPRQQRVSLLDGVKEAVQGVLRPESAGAAAPANHGARVRSLLQPLLSRTAAVCLHLLTI